MLLAYHFLTFIKIAQLTLENGCSHDQFIVTQFFAIFDLFLKLSNYFLVD